jgi:hypothetical protein
MRCVRVPTGARRGFPPRRGNAAPSARSSDGRRSTRPSPAESCASVARWTADALPPARESQRRPVAGRPGRRELARRDRRCGRRRRIPRGVEAALRARRVCAKRATVERSTQRVSHPAGSRPTPLFAWPHAKLAGVIDDWPAVQGTGRSRRGARGDSRAPIAICTRSPSAGTGRGKARTRRRTHDLLLRGYARPHSLLRQSTGMHESAWSGIGRTSFHWRPRIALRTATCADVRRVADGGAPREPLAVDSGGRNPVRLTNEIHD